MQHNKIVDGFFGLCVGDALGVPVEFTSRQSLKTLPVSEMIGYGTHRQPPGTWSDDSSLAFCLAESLCHGFDLHDLSKRFCQWLDNGYWTPHGVVFDIGNATHQAIDRLRQGIAPTAAGGNSEFSNGNGSLMRILPLAYYLENETDSDKKFAMIHDVSALTHGHPRSQMACGIYVQFAINLLHGDTPRSAYQNMREIIKAAYVKPPYSNELRHFSRMLDDNIASYAEESIESSGYVIDTLEASLWCLLKYGSYAETVLAAVNLGKDTDTTGAVAGGLAGIAYGFEQIPAAWVEQIARKDDIIELANRLYTKIHEKAT